MIAKPKRLAGDRPVPPTPLSCSVLVLNRFYMAVHVVGARRAFGLLYRETAEVIHVEEGQYGTYDFAAWQEISQLTEDGPADVDWVRTVDSRLRVPRVIRLLKFDRAVRPTLRFSRRSLFARDGNCCQYCGRTFPSSQLSMDHVVPRIQGGDTSWENIVCACIACNTRKGGRTPQQARMRLTRKPAKPRGNPLIAAKLTNPKYRVWLAFLRAEKDV